MDDPAVAAEAERLAAQLAAEQGVAGVGSYWRTGLPALRSQDGRQALIAARVLGDQKAATEVLERIAPRYRGEHGPVSVSLGGPAAVQREVTSTIQEDLLRAELIALPVTLVLLILVFGSAVAALLPLGVGIVAILGTNAVLRGLTEVTDVSVFAQNLTTALGLGLAIDYALFIVRRFREELMRRTGSGGRRRSHPAHRGAHRAVLRADRRGLPLGDDVLPDVLPALLRLRRGRGGPARGGGRAHPARRRPWCCWASGSTPWTCAGCGAGVPRPTPQRNRAGAGGGRPRW